MVRSKGRLFWFGYSTVLAAVALVVCIGTASADVIYRSIDGYGNNLLNPDWGTPGSQLLRHGVPPAYADGISVPRGIGLLPSPRAVSNAVAAQSTSIPNSRGASDFLWQWGQFLDHDISLTPTADPAEPLPIPVPAGDSHFVPPIAFSRSAYDETTGTGPGNPRQQVNVLTSFIDASQVYGSDRTTADMLRSFEGGKLKTFETDDGHVLLPLASGNSTFAPGDMFLAGDVRANEQVALTAMHTVFVREHNRLAAEIADANPSFTDEKIYQEARKLVGAMMQTITYNEFLPMLLGKGALGPYQGYRDDVDPRVSSVFSTAAFRVGHTLLSPTLLRLDENGNSIGDLPLAHAFFNPAEIVNNGGIEPILRGLAVQPAQEIDPFIVDAVRNLLFGPPVNGVGMDLAALNMQRGRDHGLPGYNEVRGLLLGSDAMFDGWDDPDLNFLPGVKDALMTVYGSINEIDLWIGGLSEAHAGDGMLGELFAAILIDQFERLRAGDRFWYENGLFEQEWMDYINGSTLSAIIMRNTSIGSMRLSAFTVPEPGALALFAIGLAGLAALRRRKGLTLSSS